MVVLVESLPSRSFAPRCLLFVFHNQQLLSVSKICQQTYQCLFKQKQAAVSLKEALITTLWTCSVPNHKSELKSQDIFLSLLWRASHRASFYPAERLGFSFSRGFLQVLAMCVGVLVYKCSQAKCWIRSLEWVLLLALLPCLYVHLVYNICQKCEIWGSATAFNNLNFLHVCWDFGQF